MAQVNLSSTQFGKFEAVTSTTITTPAGNAGEDQLLVMAHRSTLISVDIPGWTVVGSRAITGKNNSLRIWKRSLASNQSTGSVTATFSGGATSGLWFATGFNGTLPTSIPLNEITSFPNPKTIPSLQANNADQRQVIIKATADWPRSFSLASLYTQHCDNYVFAGSGGVTLAVHSLDVATTGTVTASEWNIYNEGYPATNNPVSPLGTTLDQEQIIYASFLINPLVVSSSGSLVVTTDFPTLAVSVTEPTKTLDFGATHQFSATVTGSTQGVTWSVVDGDGEITSAGLFTAKAVDVVRIRATSNQNNLFYGEAVVTVNPTAPTLSPATGDSPVNVSGTGIPGATLSLYIDSVLFNTVVVDLNGTWTTSVASSAGIYQMYATQTQDGRTSIPSATQTLTINGGTTPPPIVSESLRQPRARSWFKFPKTQHKIKT